MIFNIIVIIAALVIAYMWVIRGFFSALIHLVCTVIAGAVAFGVWEPAAYWMLDSAPASGFASNLTGMAFALGLLVPFGVTLGLLRVIVDLLLPANVVLSTKFNYIGGGVCGVLSGVLTAGLLAIGLSFFRTAPDNGQAFVFRNGSWAKQAALWVPIDRVAAGFYSNLSERAFRVSEPLAKWHPDVESEGSAMRLSAFEGRDRNNARPADFKVLGRFSVGEGGKAKLAQLLSDQWHVGKSQRAKDISGNDFPPDSHIEGVLINFLPGAKEKDGKVSVGGAQVWMTLENSDGDTMTVFPIAVASQADAAKPVFQRWWYESEGDFIGSVGGGSEALFGFEFVAPPGYEPIALYVKGARATLDEEGRSKKVKLSSNFDRDGTIASGFSLLSGGTSTGPAETNFDLAGAAKAVVKRDPNSGQVQPPDGVLVRDTIGITIQKGMHDPLQIDETQKNLIIGGEVTLSLEQLKSGQQGLDKALQITRLQSAADQVVVQINAAPDSQFSILSPTFGQEENSPPPTIYDNNNQPYVPVGFIYQDETKFILHFTPGQQLAKYGDLPKMSASRPKQKLMLIYRISRGVSMKYYGSGNKIAVEFDPAFKPGN